VNISGDGTILISHGSEYLKAKSCAKPENRTSDEQQLACDSADHTLA
jgi:hypothetical protein